ncbi:MAG: archaeosortase/exosortase family protein, partial [Planctomycetes bacterium]|nr:archaeosortase/exosortase family protein [Planctomycetota bacterium]
MTTAANPSSSPMRNSAVAKPAAAEWITPAGWAGIVLIGAAFLGLYFRWFFLQGVQSASAPQDWGHAFLIPLISGYLLWRERAAIAQVRVATFWPALAPLLLGIMTYFTCVLVIKNHMLQGMAMLLTLFAVTLLTLGPAMMRYLFVPIAFLSLGITVAEIIMIKITFPLQLIASQGAYGILLILGVPFGFDISVNGNTLEITSSAGQTFPLNVAEACSGMRMVIAFLALGASVAILSTKIWWQRIALILLGPVVAVAM